MIVNCPSCGGGVADTALQCVHCGATLQQTFLQGILSSKKPGEGHLKYVRQNQEVTSARKTLTVTAILVCLCLIPFALKTGLPWLVAGMCVSPIIMTVNLLRGKF